ncbi:MAG: TetR family transcriptional regulator [Archangiaceae bacterium]|nr:TetR family transcriptional regulator [Archangiaceae bacterium]
MRATARILVKHGYEGTTTNRVAEVAGVSVGSLYQYFPGKEALVAALVERHQAEMLEALKPDPAMLGLPLDELVPRLCEAMLRAHAVNPALDSVLYEVAPRLGKPPTVLRDTGVALVKAILEIHGPKLRPLDPDLTAFMVVKTVEGLCHEATLSRPELLKDPRFLDEMSELLLRYVRPG